MGSAAAFTAQDRAFTLRQAAHKLDTALLALETHAMRHAGSVPDEARQSDHRLLIDVAAQVCWEYLVQRELNGALDHDELRERHRIPDEVWRRLGASPRST